jgi:hypothetical protein
LLEREPRKHQIKPLIFASQKFGCYPKTIWYRYDFTRCQPSHQIGIGFRFHRSPNII